MTSLFDPLPKTQTEFYISVLAASISSLKTNTYLDNFDAERFNLDGLDHSLDFDVDRRVFYFDWFLKNHSELFRAYSLLGDSDSKILFLFLTTYRLAGHLSVKLPVSYVLKTVESEQYKAVERASESKLAISGMFGRLNHYDFEYDGNRYTADCLGFESYLFRRQYFFLRNGVNISPQPGDFVVDGGACTGDTALVFSNAVGTEGRVYAFDPVAEHLEILAFNIKQFPLKNVKAMPYGLSDKNVDSEPLVIAQYSPGFSSRNRNVPLRSIDSLVTANEIPRVDFIKLDVEGSELEALAGAKRSIIKFRPKMAISLYHNPNDIFEIVKFVHQEFNFFRLYLDHYTIHQEETVLYCVA